MKNSKSLYLLIFTAISVAALLFYFALQPKIEDNNQYESLSVIKVKVREEQLFIKKAIWGVSADKAAIVVSRDSSQFVDIKKDLVFEGIRTGYLYFLKNDTLNLFLDTMTPIFYNDSFKNLVRVDTNDNNIRRVYTMYGKNELIQDSIKIIKF